MSKEQILKYLTDLTALEEIDNLKNLNATIIGNKFNLSRNTVSQYLNEFVDEDILIKINTRPVYFFHKKTFEKRFNIALEKNNYSSIEEIHELINQSKGNSLFKKVIGYEESLYFPIEQIKMAANYPNTGLPILFHGPTGSGKSFLAELMYEYSICEGILDKNAPFMVLNCAEFADNPELLTANLFGFTKGAFTGADSEKKGLIEEADGGILFLDEVHSLKPESQEKLFLFMDKGKFRPLGENDKWRTSKVRFIFATTEDLDKVLLKTFLRRIPIIANIPCLEKRTPKEKSQMILSFFQQESKNIDKKIKLSNQVMNILQNNNFMGNVGELKNCIKYACANAYTLNKNDEYITIRISNLPNSAFSNLKNEKDIITEKEESYMNINKASIEFKSNEMQNKLFNLYSKILTNYDNFFKEEQWGLDDVINNNNRLIYNYYDYLLSTKESTSFSYKKNTIENLIKDIIKDSFDRAKFKENTNIINAIAEYILESNKIKESISLKDKIDYTACKKVLNFFQINYPKEYIIIKEITTTINNSFDFNLCLMDELVVIHNTIMISNGIDSDRILGIIISHGSSTASSIADATNQMIGEYIFEAIDMPIGSTTDNVIVKLKSYLRKMINYKNIILLVDMGSLEEIYNGLEILEDKTVGIINNITTRLALEIGLDILMKKDIESILESTSKSITTNYKIIKPKEKKKAIITTCETGIGTATNFAKLIKSSLPQSSTIEVIAVEYNILNIEKEKNKHLDEYEVKVIIGTKNPNIKNKVFIPIEKIVSGEAIDSLKEYLNEYIPDEYLDEFNHKIIKNFSLQNIIKQLTILNADKIIDYIEEALNNLQSAMGLKFQNNTIIGLYIHICCMIERLIMHNAINSHRDLEILINSKDNFIKHCKDSFSVIEKTFSVDIPTSEIAYIYDYIKNDCNYKN